MRLLLVISLALPSAARHIIEGPIGEIEEAAQTVVRADETLADRQAPPESRAQAQAARSSGVDRISSIAATNPTDVRVNLAAASSLLRVNEPVRAEQAAERAVVIAPENPDAYLQRGSARLNQGKYDEAVADFRAVLQRRPGDPAATAGLKLSEGRTRSGAGVVSNPPPATPTLNQSTPGTTAPAGGAPAAALTDLDKKAAEKKRAQELTLVQYHASRMAEANGDWKEALARASQALALDPESRFLKDHHDSVVAGMEAARVAEERKRRRKPLKRVPGEAKSIGPSDFMDGYLHYLRRSQKARRVDFNDVDTSGVGATYFPDVLEELRKPARDATVKIDARRGWTVKQNQQWLLMGRLVLSLRGELTIKRDCRWEFDGELEAGDDRYDFDKGNRGFLGEALTAIGRHSPGKVYYTQIRGSKPIREKGRLENCE